MHASYRYSRRSRGRRRAEWHLEQAAAFSLQVAGTDQAVKAAFFELSGDELDALLEIYGLHYGELAREYARITIPKWRAGRVRMSGMVAERLFALMPPFMPAGRKNAIVEAIWRRYGPHSAKYVYLGPDSDPGAVAGAVEEYFEKLNVLHPFPDALRQRFDWLASKDSIAKERLLNHFMDRQRATALESLRANLPTLLAGMHADEGGTISRLSHTVFVGNHRVEIQADPLRAGFALSDSPNDRVQPPAVRIPTGLWMSGAAVGALVLFALLRACS